MPLVVARSSVFTHIGDACRATGFLPPTAVECTELNGRCRLPTCPRPIPATGRVRRNTRNGARQEARTREDARTHQRPCRGAVSPRRQRLHRQPATEEPSRRPRQTVRATRRHSRPAPSARSHASTPATTAPTHRCRYHLSVLSSGIWAAQTRGPSPTLWRSNGGPSKLDAPDRVVFVRPVAGGAIKARADGRDSFQRHP